MLCWVRYEYNFPPYLNLIHYNPWHGDNIPLACKKTASVVYFGYRTSVFNLVVNVSTNIALVALGDAPARDVILSIFQVHHTDRAGIDGLLLALSRYSGRDTT